MSRGGLLTLVVLAVGCGRVGFGSVGTSDGALDDGGPTNDAARAGCTVTESLGVATSDFAAGQPAWSTKYTNAPAMVDFPSGQMRVTPGAFAGDAYSGISGPVGNYTSHRVFVHVPTMVNTATCAQASLVLAEDLATATYFELDQSCGQLVAHSWSVGVDTKLTTIPYDPVAQAWWQLREAAGTSYFETSRDGTMWTPIATTATPSFVTHAYVDLGGGTYQLEGAPIGEILYDDLGECIGP